MRGGGGTELLQTVEQKVEMVLYICPLVSPGIRSMICPMKSRIHLCARSEKLEMHSKENY